MLQHHPYQLMTGVCCPKMQVKSRTSITVPLETLKGKQFRWICQPTSIQQEVRCREVEHFLVIYPPVVTDS